MTLILTENLHPGAFIVSEANGFRSRDTVTIPVGQTVRVAMVLGAAGTVAGITSSAAADPDNTGNGALTLDGAAPVAGNVKDGVYRVVMTGANAFTVTDPAGKEIGKGATGQVFAKDVKFVLAAGATPFVIGDAFGITVGREAVADEVFVPLAPSAADGSAEARAIAIYPAYTAAGQAKRIAVFARDGEVRASDLEWPAGITAAQQAEAVEQLRRRGIILR